MPIPWKKARLSAAAAAGVGSGVGISRLVSALRSKHRAASSSSPLVVQTGFPTSLADLVVKNRSRLKTPSLSSSTPASRKKHSHHHRHASPPPVPHSHSGQRVDSFASEIITAIRSPSSRSQSGAVSDDAIAESNPDLSPIAKAINTTPCCAESAVPSPVEEISNFSPVPNREASTDKDNKFSLISPSPVKVSVPLTFQRTRRVRVGFQAKVVFLLIMAVCTKDLVMMITASAFALLLLEYIVGSHLLPLLRSTKGNCDSLLKGSDFNSTTSREGTSDDSNSVRRSNYSESFSSGRSSASSHASDRRMLISADRKDPSSTERNLCNPKEESRPVKEKKKHWSKIVTSKFRAAIWGKIVRDLSRACSDPCSWDTSTMRVAEEIFEGFRETEEAFDDEGDDCSERICTPSSQDSNESLSVDVKNSGCVGQNLTDVQKSSGRSFEHLVLIVIVLSGLIGGRIIALGLTVACCYLVKFTAMSVRNRELCQSASVRSLRL